ncbi:Ubiquitin carboxyl-terminal hydrolase 10 [Xylographa parallela]|nr:Ubiquitin carboxyl-terminal hydrolase 10 [Xylographa parallela]
MPAPMPRPYHQQYYPMMHSPYPMQHNAPPMSLRPNPLPHSLSSSSLRSNHALLSPPLPDHTAPINQPDPATLTSPETVPAPVPGPPSFAPIHRMPFYPPLPWLSVPDAAFPSRPSRRRRRKPPPQSSSIPVELPPRLEGPVTTDEPVHTEEKRRALPAPSQPALIDPPPSSISATPTTSKAPSEADSTQPTTPSSAIIPQQLSRPLSDTLPKTNSRLSSRIHPIVPIVPAVARSSKRQSISVISEVTKIVDTASVSDPFSAIHNTSQVEFVESESVHSDRTSKASSPAIKATPKSWADLVRSKAPLQASTASNSQDTSSSLDNSVSTFRGGSLSDVLTTFNVTDSETRSKIAFIKPRGLVNTGNLCYMNSILQILVFCVPFYKFLDQVGKQAVHSFKSETPMLDAMIMFMHEYPVIDSAASIEQLRLRLKDSELEQYGDAFTPEFVYEVIRRLPRFSTMRRGHQQDAEEFLGFLLEEMHDECAKTMKSSVSRIGSTEAPADDDVVSTTTELITSGESGWLEVGPKQKSAITRSSGTIDTESPVTKIFGGKLRSELRVPGVKTSVTLEPYQPLQLDIGSSQVNNIVDALKNLTRSEILHGDFNSPRGPGVAATKQVFIETLPPVLILHLKRFQYDNAGGTQKIWKKVGYPLELEIPKEVFPQHKRGAYLAHGGLPRYRLIGVVYHHGKNASGGHYTVDVRRQDGREWIRLDDTVIRRVRSGDVAEGGSEEDPKVLAAALEQHKNDSNTSSNIYDQVRQDDEETGQTDSGWNQVHGATPNAGTGSKKWSGVVNGTATPGSSSGMRTPVGRYSVKDNKVAYILFYQRL